LMMIEPLCAVCWLNGIRSLGAYCDVCGVYLCDRCKNLPAARGKALLKFKLLRGIRDQYNQVVGLA
jgi:hypothetical protein